LTRRNSLISYDGFRKSAESCSQTDLWRSSKRVRSLVTIHFFNADDLYADIIFPVLPRWFTEPLRANDPFSSARQSGDSFSLALPSPPLTPVEKAPHEHVILEFLFKSVFESRFINLKPTGLFAFLGGEVDWLTLNDGSRCSGLFHAVLFAMPQRAIS
jgi:hypothetical protein